MDNSPTKSALSRRGFLKAAGAALAFLPVLEAEPDRAATAAASFRPLTLPLQAENGGPEPDVLIRMQGDVQRARWPRRPPSAAG